MGGVRATAELIELAARKLLERGLPQGVDWVEVSVGIRSLEFVRGLPKGNGLLFGRWDVEEPAGLELVADREWAEGVLAWFVTEKFDELERAWMAELGVAAGISAGKREERAALFWRDHRGELEGVDRQAGILFRKSPDDQFREAWKLGRRIRRSKGWRMSVKVPCLGETHGMEFTLRGVRSSVHSHEGLLLLERLGEGCGVEFHRWRTGEWQESVPMCLLFAMRRWRRDVAFDPGPFVALIQEEWLVAGGFAADLVGAERDVVVQTVDGRRIRLGDTREWYRSVYKRGLRASDGRFPLGWQGERPVWLVRPANVVVE